jgi:hypothetical protein
MELKNIFHENPVEVRSFDGRLVNWTFSIEFRKLLTSCLRRGRWSTRNRESKLPF